MSPTGVDLEEERRARLALSLVTEPGSFSYTMLAHELGGTGLLRALRQDPDRHQALRAAARRLPTVDVDATMAEARGKGLRFVVPGDEEWPAALSDLAAAGPLQKQGGPPIGLWVKGPLRLDAIGDAIAVVGSRSSTMYGEQIAGDLAAELGLAGVATISGAAYGIDYAAHRGAASARATNVAVLACGADLAYPAAHRRMLQHLGEEQAVISEAPPGGAPLRMRFLARNRLIAALAKGTVVVEAAARSGALNTLNWTQRLNRVAMAVPGPISSAPSEGAHEAIRSGMATLVTRAADVLELIGRPGEHLTEVPRGPATARDHLSADLRLLLDAVPVEMAARVDSIAYVASMEIVTARQGLQRLAEHGLVHHDDQGWRLTEQALR